MTTDQSEHFKPEFLANRGGDTVGEALGRMIEYFNREDRDSELLISTGYFNPEGFEQIAKALKYVKRVQILLGVEPTVNRTLFLDSTRTQGREQLMEGLEQHHRELIMDRDRLGFTWQARSNAVDLIKWLRSPGVEVRRYEKGFIHGKAYVLGEEWDEGKEYNGVVVGSSNFTAAGLSHNIEMNLGNYSSSTIRRVAEYYQELWEQSEPFDLAALYEDLFKEHSPFLIFLRMLQEMYGKLDDEELKYHLNLTEFQQHGVAQVYEILRKYGGAIVADGVGLGKSFVAGSLIKKALREDRQRVLLIAPASIIKGMWTKFLKFHMLSDCETISYEKLARDIQLNGDRSNLIFDKDHYALIIVDEGHSYRSPNTDRARSLRNLLRNSSKFDYGRKQIVFLTATPINNTPMDLYHLISYFVRNDAAMLGKGITSIRKYFKEAEKQNPEDLSPEHTRKIVDELVVKRTRRFIKQHYANDTIKIREEVVPIEFPETEVTPVRYEFEHGHPGFFDKFRRILSVDSGEDALVTTSGWDQPLCLALYNQVRYRRENPSSQGGQEAEPIPRTTNDGLFRSLMLKRLESSNKSFRKTCKNLLNKHSEFLKALDEEGRVLKTSEIKSWIRTDIDETDKEFDIEQAKTREEYGSDWRAFLFCGPCTKQLENLERPTGEQIHSDSRTPSDEPCLRCDIISDSRILEQLKQEIKQPAEEDIKLKALRDQLIQIIHQARTDAQGTPSPEKPDQVREGVGPTQPEDEERYQKVFCDNRKVLVFTFYRDTAKWLRNHLAKAIENTPELHNYVGRIAVVTGNESDALKIAGEFCPESMESGAEDKYDIMISTDVLAEGINLQQCRNIINYDLPWNPMRLVQRHGRIDRIGSKHPQVFIKCFLPDDQIEELLSLESTLQRKINQAAEHFGLEDMIIPDSKVQEVNFTQTKAKITQIIAGDSSMFNEGSEQDYVSSEELRQIFRNNRKEYLLYLQRLPMGSGSGRFKEGEPDAFIFCAKVKQHEEPQFIYVPQDALIANKPKSAAEHAKPEINDNKCLSLVFCSNTEERKLSTAQYEGSFEAWGKARDHLYRFWMGMTDPSKSQESIPRAIRRAVMILRDPRSGLTQSEFERTVNTIETAWDDRIQASIRQALEDHQFDPKGFAERIAQIIIEESMYEFKRQRYYEEIEIDDIQLICWMAITGSKEE